MINRQLDQNYIEKFFGDPRVLDDMSNTEIKREISHLRKYYIRIGDYTRGIDPTAQAIYEFVKH